MNWLKRLLDVADPPDGLETVEAREKGLAALRRVTESLRRERGCSQACIDAADPFHLPDCPQRQG